MILAREFQCDPSTLARIPLSVFPFGESGAFCIHPRIPWSWYDCLAMLSMLPSVHVTWRAGTFGQ